MNSLPVSPARKARIGRSSLYVTKPSSERHSKSLLSQLQDNDLFVHVPVSPHAQLPLPGFAPGK